jgi:hypothetical protein
MKQYAIASIEVIGWHRWEGAPERQAFLRVSHRHTFKITAYAAVAHGDREIECFDLADEVRHTLSAEFSMPQYHRHHLDFGMMSCEHIAEWLCKRLRLARCIVLEDGMQGAEVCND